MGFLPLLPSCGKSCKGMNYGKRIINRIFATFAIMWQKWQKDELWILPLLPSCGKRINNGIFALLPLCGKSGKRLNYGIFARFIS